MKKIILILLLILIFPAFGQEMPIPQIPERSKTKIEIIETNGIFFLLCVDGQKIFVVMHENAATMILLGGCNGESQKTNIAENR